MLYRSNIYQVPIQKHKSATNPAGPVKVVNSVYPELISTSPEIDSQPVIVSYCDYGTEWDYYDFLEFCKTNNLDGCIPAYTGFHPHMLGTDHYAYIKTTPNSYKALQIREKAPFTDNKMAEWASNGTYYFKSGKIMNTYFQKLIESGDMINWEYYVSMVYNAMIADGLNIMVFPIKKMLQWGTPYDLEIYKSWSAYFSKKQIPISPLPAILPNSDTRLEDIITKIGRAHV